MTGWTEERVEFLKSFVRDGLSCSQIAAKLGGVTRNAVIGKLTRLGTPKGKFTGRPDKPKPRKPRVQQRVVIRPRCNSGVEMAVVDVQIHEPPVELAAFDAAIPIGQRRALVELTDFTCRWPIGDPGSADFYFCGGAAVDGRVYCAGHARCAYQPGSAKRAYIPLRKDAA